MHINGPSQVHGPQPVNAPHRVAGAEKAASVNQASQADQLDISPQASLVSRVKELPDIREDRVSEIRKQIEAGAYETDEKLDIALDRLLDELV